MTTLYTKQGRRYVIWGNLEDRWNHSDDPMQVGTFRLISCPAPGHFRFQHDVTPDTASFLAAASIAFDAMERAMNEKAQSAPSASPKPYTAEQKRLIEQFRSDMAAAGALVPLYWNTGTANEIAQAGIEAVRKAAGLP